MGREKEGDDARELGEVVASGITGRIGVVDGEADVDGESEEGEVDFYDRSKQTLFKLVLACPGEDQIRI